MKKNHNILSLFDKKFDKVESSTNFNFQALMNNVKFDETDTHLYVYNFPSAFGDTQNKNNRVYDQTSLKEASQQFNKVHEENPYFGYIFDGHRDEDSYENIIGRILKLKISESNKCILSDLKLNKGAKSFNTISNIVKDGDPIGISMRIISPSSMFLSKNEIEQLSSGINWLSEDNAGIHELMGKDDEIEYISGDAYIQRFDLTQFPSFNQTFVSKATGKPGKSESAIHKFKEYTESSCLISNSNRCITDSCRFKRTVKDFLELISKDESINIIKNNPTLYDDMLKFGYMNLSEFNFDDMTDRKYLSGKLYDFKIGRDDSDIQIKTIDDILGTETLLDYILSNTKIEASKFISMLNMMVMKCIDVDEIFYQVITINYLHQIVLSTLLLNGKDQSEIINSRQVSSKLADNANSDDPNSDILATFLNGIDAGLDVYDFTNLMFSYMYSYIDKYSSLMPPIAIVNESFAKFKKVNATKIFKKSFVK